MGADEQDAKAAVGGSWVEHLGACETHCDAISTMHEA